MNTKNQTMIGVQDDARRAEAAGHSTPVAWVQA